MYRPKVNRPLILVLALFFLLLGAMESHAFTCQNAFVAHVEHRYERPPNRMILPQKERPEGFYLSAVSTLHVTKSRMLVGILLRDLRDGQYDPKSKTDYVKTTMARLMEFGVIYRSDLDQLLAYANDPQVRASLDAITPRVGSEIDPQFTLTTMILEYAMAGDQPIKDYVRARLPKDVGSP